VLLLGVGTFRIHLTYCSFKTNFYRKEFTLTNIESFSFRFLEIGVVTSVTARRVSVDNYREERKLEVRKSLKNSCKSSQVMY